MFLFFSNPTGPFCAHGRCSVCPKATNREHHIDVASVPNGSARTALSRQFKWNVTVARNNHTTDKFHSHLCSKLYFLVLSMALGLTQHLREMSTRNISWRGKGGRCVGLTTFPPSGADCLEIWETEPPGTLWACNGIDLPVYVFFFYSNWTILCPWKVLRLSSSYEQRTTCRCCQCSEWECKDRSIKTIQIKCDSC
jgi:hypothetical protein